MSENELGRLRWRCRRGMLELDAALLAFLERRYPAADAELRQAFAALLAREDADILSLMTGNAGPESEAQARLLALLSEPVSSPGG